MEKRIEEKYEVRYDGLDILKAICAFLVICIHCSFKGKMGACIISLTRIAVPIFFMITGFFYQNVMVKNGEKRQVVKILKLTIIANGVYILWNVVTNIMSGDNLSIHFKNLITENSLIKWIVFNESPFGGHLWYLNAIFYVLCLAFFITHKIKNKSMIKRMMNIITPILLCCDLVVGKYSILLWGREFPYILVRNFVFVGIPYFWIGIMIYNYQTKRKAKLETWISFCFLFTVTTLIEHIFLVCLNVNATRDHYISTTFLAISTFVLFVELYKNRKKNKAELFMGIVGKKYSTWIYIFHPIVITVMSVITNWLGIYEIYKILAPIFVYIITIVLVHYIYQAGDYIINEKFIKKVK